MNRETKQLLSMYGAAGLLKAWNDGPTEIWALRTHAGLMID